MSNTTPDTEPKTERTDTPLALADRDALRRVLLRIEELLLESRGAELRRNGNYDCYGVGLLRLEELKPGVAVIHFSHFSLDVDEPLERSVVACEPFKEGPSGHQPGALVVRLEGRDKPVNARWLVPGTDEGEKRLRAASDAWRLSGEALSLIGMLLGGPVWARPREPDGILLTEVQRRILASFAEGSVGTTDVRFSTAEWERERATLLSAGWLVPGSTPSRLHLLTDAGREALARKAG